jgi:tRNA nucleotidyltransferase/poly(A) polymerase
MSVREILRKALLKEATTSSIERVTKMLNALEFKNDVVQNGGEIYAVGGIVRDAIMGKSSDDLDIVVRGIPYEKLFKILQKYGTPKDTSKDNDEGKDFGATKFVSRNQKFNKFLHDNGVIDSIDVMLPRKDAKDPNIQGHKGITSDVNFNYTIYDDLLRRDITINAIALDLNGKIIDIDGKGQADIKNNVIRAVSGDAFTEDPLRIVRAIRFAARFNAEIAPETLNLIKQNVKLLSNKKELPAERFLAEFKKMIGKADLGRAVKLLVETGAFEAIFGVKYPNIPFTEFNKARTVGEMGYLMFHGLPNAVDLYTKNIDNTIDNINQLKGLILYEKINQNKIETAEEIKKLADIYKISKDVFTSAFISDAARKIGDKFTSQELPVNQGDVKFSGDLIGPMIINFANENQIELKKADVGIKIGQLKRMVIDAVYTGQLRNDEEVIKDFIIKKISLLFR